MQLFFFSYIQRDTVLSLKTLKEIGNQRTGQLGRTTYFADDTTLFTQTSDNVKAIANHLLVELSS